MELKIISYERHSDVMDVFNQWKTSNHVHIIDVQLSTSSSEQGSTRYTLLVKYENITNSKFYYITRYSFDPHTAVYGPFSTQQEAWYNMCQNAREEKRIDTEENGYVVNYNECEDAGEIILSNNPCNNSEPDTTTFIIIEIPTKE